MHTRARRETRSTKSKSRATVGANFFSRRSLSCFCAVGMSSWELSPIHKHALSVISASSLVSANGDRIIARDPLSLQITLTWKLPLQRQPSASSKTPLPSTHDTQPHFTSLSLSPAPSNFILAFAPKANAAWIIDPTQESVVARVDVGDEGAVAVAWSTAPAADTVLVWSAHHVSSASLRERGRDS